MFRDLYSTKARVHSFRPVLGQEAASPFTQLDSARDQYLVALCEEARLSLGAFPAERQLLYHHPLIGLEELAFIDALAQLERASQASVWPGDKSICEKSGAEGAIDPLDWQEARRSGYILDSQLESGELGDLRSAYHALMQSERKPRARTSLAASLSPWLAEDLMQVIRTELAQLFVRYARARAQEVKPPSLWLFAAEHSSGHPQRFVPGTNLQWSEGPVAILLQLLDDMAVPQSAWKELLLEAAWTLPGWTAWLQQESTVEPSLSFIACMALRFSIESRRLTAVARRHRFAATWYGVHAWIDSQRLPLNEKGSISTHQLFAFDLEAREARWRRLFAEKLGAPAPLSNSVRAELQGVFCIDPRCEPFRHAWEACGAIETLSQSGAFLLKPQHLSGASYPQAEELAVQLLQTLAHAARLVLICAHSHPHSDPWCSGFLECTACGGYSGRQHAAYSAQLLNDPVLRLRLSGLGYDIPSDTYFIAGIYRTDLGTVELLDADLVPQSHASDCARLLSSLHEASQSLSPRGPEPAAMSGAAGHAAFLIGPRSFTRGSELDGGCFLHSYDAARDPDAFQLAKIFQRALQVTLSINLHYFFAAVDPTFWSAGSYDDLQTLSNGCKVSLAHGDLVRSIPTEALRSPRNQALHQPMRLQVLVVASEAQIEKALAASARALRAWQLQWFSLVRIDPLSGAMQLLRAPLALQEVL